MSRVAMSLVLLIVAAACTAEGQSLDASNDGTRVHLSPGGEVEVALEGNATTGFIWELVELDPDVIASGNEPAYKETESGAVGDGGSWTWTLVGQEQGECTVRFVYHRPWEDEPPEDTFSFTAVVDP